MGFRGIKWFTKIKAKGRNIRKIIIPFLFLFLTFLYSCSEKSETATDLINKASALWNGKEFAEPQKAIEYLNKAITLQPDNDAAYNMRGNIYGALGQQQKAIEDFSKAIQLNPTNADYFNNRGSIYNKLGQYQQAIKDFDEAILFDSNVAAFYNNRGGVQLRHGDKKIGCLDAQKACALKFCDLLEWAKKEGICN